MYMLKACGPRRTHYLISRYFRVIAQGKRTSLFFCLRSLSKNVSVLCNDLDFFFFFLRLFFFSLFWFLIPVLIKVFRSVRLMMRPAFYTHLPFAGCFSITVEICDLVVSFCVSSFSPLLL